MDKENQNKEFRRLLELYLAKNESPEEFQALQEMIRSGLYDQADDEVLQILQAQEVEPVSKEVFQEVLSNIQEVTNPRTSFSRWWMAAAASLLLLATATIWIWSQQAPAPLAERNEATQQEKLAFRDKQFVRLPDGSSVVLNSGSELTYTASFGKEVREVILTGEGYFDIVHDENHPFVVHAGNTTTTVLGTAFNINATVTETVVTVTRGKVKVADQWGHVQLIERDQQVTVSNQSEGFIKKETSAEKATAWMKTFLIIDNATMKEAVIQLEQHYSAKIELSNVGLEKCMIQGTFFSGESLDTVLSLICKVRNWTYRRNEAGAITIVGNGC